MATCADDRFLAKAQCQKIFRGSHCRLENRLKGQFAGFDVLSQHHIAHLDGFNWPGTRFGPDRRSSGETAYALQAIPWVSTALRLFGDNRDLLSADALRIGEAVPPLPPRRRVGLRI